MRIAPSERLKKSIGNDNIREELEVLKQNSDHVFEIFAGKCDKNFLVLQIFADNLACRLKHNKKSPNHLPS